MNIEKYLNNTFSAKIKPIETNLGLSNKIYKFEYNNANYALRLPINKSNMDHRELERSIQMLRLDMDFEEMYYDDVNCIRITKWIDELKSFSQYSNDDKYLKTINRIKQFHNLSIKTNINFNLEKKYNFYLLNIKNKLFDYKSYSFIIDNYRNLDCPICLSHNDLVDGNILFKDDKCYLIDYEYASNNYEYFDLMSLLSENCIYDQKIRNYIYKLYFEKEISNSQLCICNKIELAQELLWSAWANYEYDNKHKDIYLDIFKTKTKRINQLLNL